MDKLSMHCLYNNKHLVRDISHGNNICGMQCSDSMIQMQYTDSELQKTYGPCTTTRLNVAMLWGAFKQTCKE